MSHSNSSLNTFASCMAKYEQNYILHNQPEKISPHLTFGTMAHEVLHKAGIQRDEIRDGVREKTDYNTVIPSELLYPELKEEFQIFNWAAYFIQVIRKTEEYENELVKSINAPCIIERELKLQLTSDQMKKYGYNNISEPIVGIIDVLIRTKDQAIVLDYKFSSSKKTQDDFDMNSQLPLYALLVSETYGIPLHNIRIGYIDIPKKSFDKPALLSNGLLSRAKTQNVLQDAYALYVKTVHGDDPYYNCDEGGYYYECWCALANNKPAYLQVQFLEVDVAKQIIDDLLKAASFVEYMQRFKLPFLRKYDAYTCKSCEYLKHCKPWLGVNWNE